MFTVNIRILENGLGLPVPAHQTEQAAGLDLYAAVPDEGMLILPQQYVLVPCGFSIELPVGYEAQVRPRSGLAVRFGLTVLNSPGTIDSDYRGEVAVCLINHSDEIFYVKRGERVAQMVIAKHEQVKLVATEQALTVTARGDGGYGSTGR
jgi:dUTP pyrophosphatase